MVVYSVLCVEEVKKKETAFYLLEDIMVSFIYMAVQAIIIVGYIMCLGYGYWYLAGIILLLCFLYICFMKKYFGLHQST